MAVKGFEFGVWNTVATFMDDYYELVEETKVAKFLRRYGIAGLTKCVQTGKVVFVYIGFDELPEFDHYKVADYAVFYFTEYPAEGKVLGTDKIRSVKVFELLGFSGSTWLDFVEWFKSEVEWFEREFIDDSGRLRDWRRRGKRAKRRRRKNRKEVIK